ncbi:MAG: PatB family C-S lyase [Clostridium sp.]|nr:PatB family C-S lyase [Clostridium sp.]
MEKFDFDQAIDRHDTGCIKYDALSKFFGRTDLTPLWIADMDFAVHPAIIDALRRQTSHPVIGYAEISESYYQSVLDWLRRRHAMTVARDEIAYVPGVVKGIALSVMHFTRPGDGVVIQPPVYPPFRRVVEGNGRRCLTNPLLTDPHSGRFRFDFGGLERLVEREKPKMLILCNPHNPGGRQWNADELRRLAAICHRAGMVVVSDEIHGDLMIGSTRHIPFATVSPEAEAITVMLGAPSKTFNIPGLVSSWAVVKNPALREGFFQWLETNEFSTPTLWAAIGAEAAYTHAEGWLSQALEYITDNIAMAVEYLGVHLPGVRVMTPEASFLLWIDCRSLGYGHEELNRRLIERGHLALNPGESFGVEGEGWVRLNVATRRKVLREALGQMVEALQ